MIIFYQKYCVFVSSVIRNKENCIIVNITSNTRALRHLNSETERGIRFYSYFIV